MTNFTYDLNVVLNFISKNIDGAIGQFKDINNSAKGTSEAMKDIDSSTSSVNDSAKGTSKNFKGMEKSAKKTSNEIGKMSFDFLALRFGGEGLKRLFGGIFRDLSQGYMAASGENNQFNKAIGRLSAAFDFLKFSIFDAFANSEFWQSAIEWLTNSLNSISDWVQRNPNISITFLTIAGALGVLGSTFIKLGLVLQLFMPGGTFPAVIKSFKLLPGKIKGSFIAVKKFTVFIITKFSSAMTYATIQSHIFAITLGAMHPPLGKLYLGFKGVLGILVKVIIPFLAVIGAAALFSKYNEQLNRSLEKFGFIGNIIRVVINMLATGFNVLHGLVTGNTEAWGMLGVSIEGVTSFFSNLWEWIKNVAIRLIDFLGILEPVKKLLSGIGSVFGKVAGFISDFADETEDAAKLSREMFVAQEKIAEISDKQSGSIDNLDKSIINIAGDQESFSDALAKSSYNMEDFEDHVWDSEFSIESLGLAVDNSSINLSEYNNILADNEPPRLFSSNINDVIIPSLKSEQAEVNRTIDMYRRLFQARNSANTISNMRIGSTLSTLN